MLIINVFFIAVKKAARNILSLTCLIHLTSNTDVPSKTNSYCVNITDSKRILAVIVKSIWYRSFSCTQRGKCLHAELV